MDIYLLRDGKEFGPFNEEMTQGFLKQGTIEINDLAWTPGLISWSPLVQVLYPASAPVEEALVEETQIEETQIEELRSETVPVGEPQFEEVEEVTIEQLLVEEIVPTEILAGGTATAKQKAFLTYLGIAFSSDTTKERAAVLVNEAMEDPKLSPRVVQWNTDRLRLHPDIFAAEVQARKEDRANRFFDACQREGAECLDGVTKAHCQVLIGFLDVNHPNWDANETTAGRSYFFPAVAEKFPELVRKEWRGKLTYPRGPKIATEKLQSGAAARPYTGPSPLAALIRGAVFGLALLLALYVGVQFFTTEPVQEAPDFTGSGAQTPPAPEPPKKPEAPARAPENPPAEPPRAEVPQPGAASGIPIQTATAEPAAMDSPPTAPTIATPKTHVIITKPFDVKLRFGSAKIAAGTQFKIISQDGAHVTVIYAAETITIPAENTDLAEPLPPE